MKQTGQHNHSHDHGHDHTPEVTDENARAVARAGLLIAGFMFVELIGGWLAGSLALMADAVHMVTDAASLGLAWWAFQQARKPADARLTYGRDRLPVLIAFANAIFLLVVTIWICVEAAGRFLEPETVHSGPMFVIAVLGLLVNIGAFLMLRRGGGESLNIRSAMLHVLGDLLGSVAAIAAAIVIYFTNWYPIDPILSVFVALLIARSAISIIRQSAHILLEGAPQDIDRNALKADLMSEIPGLLDVYHVHLWLLAEGKVNATMHAAVDSEDQSDAVLENMRKRLKDVHGIGHVTIEMTTRQPAE
ncbi:cation diffusion facilitator family transporter [Roseibium salinum]|uniref:Cation diffusion facilitator family transporter n=1 Tax=Roseibium salinum TaxID=1604349 RepID=A0ABT3R1E7_9HYPH|nr:cation diffusion facilitator family transporter [Roseibium sp. DSM 29163]MCX2722980.1 cation diffusion facilitator family transporter [Roseibium sp. DSM 29163]MDN3719086.1 cation diffusion facilitator family transporter [Roseibium salinum]